METNSDSTEIFSTQDKEFLSMLADLPINVDFNKSMEISCEELGQQNTTHENTCRIFLFRLVFT